ncbi:hypothetical protein [Bdellovibrio sp. HCB274]|uniref:hypothetical protein n=1 Tax=Bdellovibrio sp. HCB274 TaxID=3394361 RepID=UPI0039B613BB
MRHLLIFVFALLLNGVAHANSYGFLRIQVPETRSDHNFTAYMAANGAQLMTFSHATGVTSAALGSQHLSAGSSTRISADYSFGTDGCSFDYLVYFSISASGPWIRIPGTFQAPNGKSSDKIPLGICGNSVCSSDPGIQRQIKEQRIQKAKNEARQLKAQIERSRKERERRSAAAYAKAQEKRITKLSSPEVAPEDRAVVAQAEKQLKEYTPVENGNSEEAPVQIESSKIVAEATLVTDEARGMTLEITADLEAMNPEFAKQYIEAGFQMWDSLLNGVTPGGEPGVYSIQRRNVVANLLNSNTLVEMAAMGARLTPVGDVIDGCEAITGIANCLPNGRKLSALERSAAALGVIIASRQAFTPVLKMLEKESRVLSAEEKILAKAIEGKKTSFASREAIEDTLKVVNEDRRFESVINNMDVKEIRTGKEVNARWLKDNWEPPFVADRPVAIGPTLSEEHYRRYYAEGINNPNGRWMMNKDAIGDLNPAQIKEKLAIENIPTHYVDVTVPAGTVRMSGYVGKNKFGSYEGTVQHFIEDNSKVIYGKPQKLAD